MTPENFCYWLRGFYEINGETTLTERQSKIISKHLNLVFAEEAKNLPTVSEKSTPKKEATGEEAVEALDKYLEQLNKSNRSGFKQSEFKPRKYC